MKKTFLLLVIAIGTLSFTISGCTHPSEKKSEQKEQKIQYKCPMDCEPGKTYDKPGKCPVCDMELETKV